MAAGRDAEKARSYQREWAQRNRERLRPMRAEGSRRWRATPKGLESVLRYDTENRAKIILRRSKCWAVSRNHTPITLTPEELHAFLLTQPAACSICKREGTHPLERRDPGQVGRWLAVDHCHVTGQVRGVLCASCNRFVGMYENAEWREKHQAYLDRKGA